MDNGPEPVNDAGSSVKNQNNKKLRKPTTVYFPLMGSSGGVEAKQKQNGKLPQHINHVSPVPTPHQKLCGGREPRLAQWG